MLQVSDMIDMFVLLEVGMEVILMVRDALCVSFHLAESIPESTLMKSFVSSTQHTSLPSEDDPV